MRHVRRDAQLDWDARGARAFRGAERVVEQDFRVADKEDERRKAGKIPVDGRSQRVPRIGAREIGGGDLVEAAGGEKRIAIGVRSRRGAGDSEIGPGRKQAGGVRARSPMSRRRISSASVSPPPAESPAA